MSLKDKVKNGLILGAPFFAGLLSVQETSCAASCPYGLVNDPYPGQCPRYTDLNGDGFCDLSQSSASTTSDYDASATSDYNEKQSTEVDTKTTSENESITAENGQQPSHQVADENSFTGGGDDLQQPDYHVIPVSILIVGIYLATHYLFSKGYLKRSKHRRIWNLLLTFGYAGTGFTGLILILLIKLGIKTVMNPSVTFWHAELSILMVVATFIHIHLYWKQFKGVFRVL